MSRRAELAQIVGALLAAAVIVAVTIAVVTAKIGPGREDDDGRGRGGDRQERVGDDRRGRDRD